MSEKIVNKYETTVTKTPKDEWFGGLRCSRKGEELWSVESLIVHGTKLEAIKEGRRMMSTIQILHSEAANS